MAKNFVQPGHTVSLTAPGETSSGDLVVVGSLAGVAAHDAGSGEPVECQLVGVFELPKDGAQINAGAPVYWSGTACTATAGANQFIGTCVATAGASATTVRVRLGGADPAGLSAQIVALAARVTALENA